MNRFARGVRVMVGVLLLGPCVLAAPADAGALGPDGQSAVFGRLGINGPAGQPQRQFKAGDKLACKVATPMRLAEFGLTVAKNDDVTVRVTGDAEFDLVLKGSTYGFVVGRSGVVSRK